MDIEKLRLAHEELRELDHIGPDYLRVLADAQLVKALWGLADWLNQSPSVYPNVVTAEGQAFCIGCWLESKLKEAGIPRPD